MASLGPTLPGFVYDPVRKKYFPAGYRPPTLPNTLSSNTRPPPKEKQPRDPNDHSGWDNRPVVAVRSGRGRFGTSGLSSAHDNWDSVPLPEKQDFNDEDVSSQWDGPVSRYQKNSTRLATLRMTSTVVEVPAGNAVASSSGTKGSISQSSVSNKAKGKEKALHSSRPVATQNLFKKSKNSHPSSKPSRLSEKSSADTFPLEDQKRKTSISNGSRYSRPTSFLQARDKLIRYSGAGSSYFVTRVYEDAFILSRLLSPSKAQALHAAQWSIPLSHTSAFITTLHTPSPVPSSTGKRESTTPPTSGSDEEGDMILAGDSNGTVYSLWLPSKGISENDDGENRSSWDSRYLFGWRTEFSTLGGGSRISALSCWQDHYIVTTFGPQPLLLLAPLPKPPTRTPICTSFRRVSDMEEHLFGGEGGEHEDSAPTLMVRPRTATDVWSAYLGDGVSVGLGCDMKFLYAQSIFHTAQRSENPGDHNGTRNGDYMTTHKTGSSVMAITRHPYSHPKNSKVLLLGLRNGAILNFDSRQAFPTPSAERSVPSNQPPPPHYIHGGHSDRSRYPPGSSSGPGSARYNANRSNATFLTGRPRFDALVPNSNPDLRNHEFVAEEDGGWRLPVPLREKTDEEITGIKMVQFINLKKPVVKFVDIVNDGLGQLCVSTMDGKLDIYDFRFSSPSSPSISLHGHNNSYSSSLPIIHHSSSGSIIAGGQDGIVRTWSVRDGQRLDYDGEALPLDSLARGGSAVKVQGLIELKDGGVGIVRDGKFEVFGGQRRSGT